MYVPYFDISIVFHRFSIDTRVYGEKLPLFQLALSKLRFQIKTKTYMRNLTCCFKFTVSSSDGTLLSSRVDPVTSKPRMRIKNKKEYDCYQELALREVATEEHRFKLTI